jgi:glycosyltransferase involved in cell wall biosynthesis
MVKKMKLSIITINRNNADGLKKTIESVANQNYKDFEYIVIDGASTDNSVEVIKSYLNIVSYYISESDKGVFDAMNKGIKHATGEFLLFLNSGDYFNNDNVLLNVIEELNEDIVIGKCNIIKEGEIVYITNSFNRITLNTLILNSLPHQAMFFKRTLFDKYGLYRDDLKLMGDWEFCIRTIILENVKYKNIDTIIADYNLEGISSQESNINKMKKEKDFVLNAIPVLLNILPDYYDFYSQQQMLKPIKWANNNRVISKIINYIYSFAVLFNR